MKTAINLGLTAGMLTAQEVIPLVANAGFDGCFWSYDLAENLPLIAQKIQEHGLEFQSVHAPFGEVDRMWKEGEGGDRYLRVLTDCLRGCADYNVPIMVSHVWIGFDPAQPTAIGIDRFGMLLAEAEKLGVKIAFENTEGENFLQAIHDQLWSSPTAGFCIDTGHEMCYNGSQDLIARYGDKLIATHLNDNMGFHNRPIPWHDDSHLFPFDGIADWQGIADRLKKVNYRDFLTFELTVNSKPGLNTHDIYQGLNGQQILDLAYKKAVQFSELMK